MEKGETEQSKKWVLALHPLSPTDPLPRTVNNLYFHQFTGNTAVHIKTIPMLPEVPGGALMCLSIFIPLCSIAPTILGLHHMAFFENCWSRGHLH